MQYIDTISSLTHTQALESAVQKHVVDHREQINEVAQSLINNSIMVAAVERESKLYNQRADEVAVQVGQLDSIN